MTHSTGACLCGGVRCEITEPFYAAAWEPLPDDGLPRFSESSRGR